MLGIKLRILSVTSSNEFTVELLDNKKETAVITLCVSDAFLSGIPDVFITKIEGFVSTLTLLDISNYIDSKKKEITNAVIALEEANEALEQGNAISVVRATGISNYARILASLVGKIGDVGVQETPSPKGSGATEGGGEQE